MSDSGSSSDPRRQSGRPDIPTSPSRPADARRRHAVRRALPFF
jgi:hypothetical protein